MGVSALGARPLHTHVRVSEGRGRGGLVKYECVHRIRSVATAPCGTAPRLDTLFVAFPRGPTPVSWPVPP